MGRVSCLSMGSYVHWMACAQGGTETATKGDGGCTFSTHTDVLKDLALYMVTRRNRPQCVCTKMVQKQWLQGWHNYIH